MKIQIRSLVLTLALTALAPLARADSNGNGIDEVGEIARNFTITNHANGQPLRLSDYAGSVILLDYFAYWCPYCRAQSPQIESGINEYYKARNGTSNGVPVTVITVSFDGSNPSYTDQLIAQFGLDIVADDFALTSYNQFGVSQQPYYVIINGVTNSPSHSAWQVLYRANNYGANIAPTNALRAVLETVQAGPPPVVIPPQITDARATNGGFEFTVPRELGRTNRVEFSTNLTTWNTLTNIFGTNGSVIVRDAPLTDKRYYRVNRLP